MTLDEAGMEEGHASASAPLRVVPLPFSIPSRPRCLHTAAVPGTIRFRAEKAASIPNSPKPHLPKTAAPTPGNGSQPTSKA